jgi:hypothetical protein
MNEYHVVMTDELGDEFSVTISIPDLVENITEWVREEYPESSIVYIQHSMQNWQNGKRIHYNGT